MDFQIVPLAERHIAGLRAVVDAVARERRYLAMLRGFPLGETRAFVRARLRCRDPFFVALTGSRVVGWCDVQRVPRDTMKHGGILGMGILDGFRAQGIGSALMHATLERAKKRGFTRVELTVRKDNRRAMALYKKFRFVAEGVKRNAFRIDGKYYDLFSMAVLFTKRRGA